MSGWNQEQEYQAGVRAERERIIKLLQEQGAALQPLIALIKGENK